MFLHTIFCMLALLAAASPAGAEEHQVLFREDFSTLDRWKPFVFPKIKTHSTYTIERSEDVHILRAESNASASAIMHVDTFNVREYPKVKWRWKVNNVYAKADVRTKEGDDYPLRVYIMFEFDPKKADVMDVITFGIAKSLYGQYPPHSSLSYVWASKDDPETFVVSPYTDKAMMVLLEKGAAKGGAWVDEEIDILSDYRKAFRKEPPVQARIAIMNDSDNTGESAVSWMEYIEVSQ